MTEDGGQDGSSSRTTGIETCPQSDMAGRSGEDERPPQRHSGPSCCCYRIRGGQDRGVRDGQDGTEVLADLCDSNQQSRPHVALQIHGLRAKWLNEKTISDREHVMHGYERLQPQSWSWNDSRAVNSRRSDVHAQCLKDCLINVLDLAVRSQTTRLFSLLPLSPAHRVLN